MRSLPLKAVGLCLGAFLTGCAYISFGPKVATDELILKAEIRSYFNEVQRAFAAGNPGALTVLFSPSITRPMTYQEIRAWGEKFFGENTNAHLRIDALEFVELGYLRAVVVITYRVETPGGKGDFGGTERDTLVKKRGRWYIASWEKVSPSR